MAKQLTVGVSNTARKGKAGWIGISGVARKIKKIWIGVGNVARLFFSSGGEATYHSQTTLANSKRDFAYGTIGDYGLIAGGLYYDSSADTYYSTSQVEAYNSSLVKSYPTATSYSSYYGRSGLVGNYLLIALGTLHDDDSTYLADVDAYNASLTKSKATNLASARTWLGSVSVGSYVLFAGGSSASSNFTSTVDAYNTSLTRSTPTALNANGRSHGGASIGKYGLLAPGSSLSSRSTVVTAYDTSLTCSAPTALTTTSLGWKGCSTKNHAVFTNSTTTFHAYDSSLTQTVGTFLSGYRGASTCGVQCGSNALIPAALSSTSASSYSTCCVLLDEALTMSYVCGLNGGHGDGAAFKVGNYVIFAGGYSSAAYPTNVVDILTYSE